MRDLRQFNVVVFWVVTSCSDVCHNPEDHDINCLIPTESTHKMASLMLKHCMATIVLLLIVLNRKILPWDGLQPYPFQHLRYRTVVTMCTTCFNIQLHDISLPECIN